MKDQLEGLVNQMVERGILFDEAVGEFEKRFIKRVLDCTHGNQSRAAEALGIHRNTLSRKIGLYKLDDRPRRREAGFLRYGPGKLQSVPERCRDLSDEALRAPRR